MVLVCTYTLALICIGVQMFFLHFIIKKTITSTTPTAYFHFIDNGNVKVKILLSDTKYLTRLRENIRIVRILC